MAKRRKSKPLSPEYIAQLCESTGRVIIAFSQYEHALAMTLKKLFKLTTLQERALVRPLSLTQKINILRRLGADFLNPDNRQILKGVLKQAEDWAEQRNELAHGYYGVRDGKFALLTFTGDAKLASRPIPWTPQKLNDLAAEIRNKTHLAENIPMLFPVGLKLPKPRPPKP